jgi:hypothetical protein
MFIYQQPLMLSSKAGDSLISQEVPRLVLEELLEVGALDEAVAEAALLSGQQVVGLKRQEAVLGALSHGSGGLVVVELVLQVLSKDSQVELSLHFDYCLIYNY